MPMRIRSSSGWCHSELVSSLTGTSDPSIGRYANAMHRSDWAAIPSMTLFNSSICKYYVSSKISLEGHAVCPINWNHHMKNCTRKTVVLHIINPGLYLLCTFPGVNAWTSPRSFTNFVHKPRIISAAPFQWDSTIPSSFWRTLTEEPDVNRTINNRWSNIMVSRKYPHNQRIECTDHK
jgi:hypothetical protein